MLASISPLGERARASRWPLTVTAYLLASVAGGALTGLLAAALGSLVPASWRSGPVAGAVVAVLLVLGLLVDLGVRGARLPSWRRQVDEAWLARYRGWIYGAGFGLQLGLGVVTIVTSATVYAVLLLAAVSGRLPVGLLLGAVFGLVRALPVLALARVDDVPALHRVFRRLERWGPPLDLLARGALALAAVAVVATPAWGGA
jgi:hypothetical protein